MLLQVNFIELKCRMWVSSLPLTLTSRPASCTAALHRSRYTADCQLEHKAATVTYQIKIKRKGRKLSSSHTKSAYYEIKVKKKIVWVSERRGLCTMK